MFALGNFAVKEIIYAVAQDFSDNILYTLDQLKNASIEVSSDPTEIKDKDGNVVRTIYPSKTGKFNSSSALLSPALINSHSGSEMQSASAEKPIQMPKIAVVPAGASIKVNDLGLNGSTLKVIGLFNNGANGVQLKQGSTASANSNTYTYAADKNVATVVVPAAQEGAPDKYLLKYERNVTSGYALENKVTEFPDAQKFTLYAAIVDPCHDAFRSAYIYIPSFQPDPSMNVNLNSDNQEVDFNGNINTDYCGSDKVLYYIYFPDEDAVTTVVSSAEAA